MTKTAVHRKKMSLYLHFLKFNCPISGTLIDAVKKC